MILAECDPDIVLLEELGFSNIEHGWGKGNICNVLRKKRDCVGVVDEDPGRAQPSYLRGLRVARNLQQHDLRLLHDNTRNNCLVLICPKLEDWVLTTARIAGVDPRDYNLPNDPDRLHEIVNYNLNKFRRLVRDLVNTARLQALKNLVRCKSISFKN